MNNGFLAAPVLLARGPRQGCPLFLSLNVTQGEVTTHNINQNNSIQRIKIPNKKTPIKELLVICIASMYIYLLHIHFILVTGRLWTGF